MGKNTKSYPAYIAVASVVIFTICHFYLINSPPNGYHQWRESDTAAIALNYYQEDFTFLHPRVNQRGAGEGITGMEFPIYCFATALLYKAFGVLHLLPRLLTLIMSLAGLWAFYRLVKSRLQSETAALFGLVALAFSPLYFYYSFKIMPDITMLSLAILSVYFFDRYILAKKYLNLIGSAALLILSALLKPVSLALFLPLLYLVWKDRLAGVRLFIVFAGFMLATLLPVFLWFQYAKSVNVQYGSPGFYLGEDFFSFPSYWFTAVHFKRLYLQRLPELWVGWALVPMFLFGAYVSWRNKIAGFFWFWFIAGVIALGLTAMLSNNHDYYGLIIIPALAAITGLGLSALWRLGPKAQMLVLLLCLSAPIAAFIRLQDRFSAEIHFETIRHDTDKVIPREALVIVEDPTTAVRLYQMNRHGWPIRHGVVLDSLLEPLHKGGNFLVLEKPLSLYDSTLYPLFDSNTERIDSLYCYRVK